MDEKKLDKDINVRSKELTDEEIVKALENCLNGDYKTKCKGCHYDESENLCQDMDRDVLDLINRLYRKNGRIQEISREKSKAYYAVAQTCAVQEETIANQKAEIERLTKWYDTQSGLYNDLQDENKELQEQVDKLKERNYWLESEHEHQCEKSYFEGVEKGESKADERIKEILTEIYDKPYEIDVQVKGYEFHKEAIETVAKAILKATNERINSIADKYGIQLEQKEDD